MPSRKPSSPVLDTSEDDASRSDAVELAEQAEAEAAEAEAVAAAARARARAIRLRNQAATDDNAAEADETDQADGTEDGEADAEAAGSDDEVTATTAIEPDAQPLDIDAVDIDSAGVEAEPLEAVEAKSSRRLPRVRVTPLFWKVLASCLTLIVIAGLLAASGWMIWHHRQAQHRQQLTAEYTAAARQTVVTLMSLDFNHAQDAVKNILDNSTGEFREDFEAQSKDFVKLAQDAKVVTEAKVTAAAVDTMSDDNASVLLSVNTEVTNTTGANKQPRPWRVAVNMVREGDRIKLSKVEFVP